MFNCLYLSNSSRFFELRWKKSVEAKTGYFHCFETPTKPLTRSPEADRESEIERQYLQRMLKRYNIKSKDIII